MNDKLNHFYKRTNKFIYLKRRKTTTFIGSLSYDYDPFDCITLSVYEKYSQTV
jgi:hypothetical protein